jgi:hypothetical protein
LPKIYPEKFVNYQHLTVPAFLGYLPQNWLCHRSPMPGLSVLAKICGLFGPQAARAHRIFFFAKICSPLAFKILIYLPGTPIYLLYRKKKLFSVKNRASNNWTPLTQAKPEQMSILSNSEESENTQSSDGVKFPFSCQNFANKINQIRFNIQKAFTFIQEKLREGITRGDKKISFLSINQEIEFDDEDLM